MGGRVRHPRRCRRIRAGGHSEGRGLPPTTLAFDIDYAPSAPSKVFVTTYADGVFSSTEGGRSWAPAGTRRFGTLVTVAVHPADAGKKDGLTTDWVHSLALHPNSEKLYAGTTAYGVDTGGGVFSYRFR